MTRSTLGITQHEQDKEKTLTRVDGLRLFDLYGLPQRATGDQ